MSRVQVRQKYRASLPTLADDEAAPLACDSTGATIVQDARASATVVNAVAVSALTQRLLVANPARRGATIYNDAAAVLYVKCGDGPATTNSFTAVLAGLTNGIGGYYEVPFDYVGEVHAISPGGGAGTILVTDFT